jgi:predicted ATP-grasp superfamily ATP-dependent carboligase
MRILVYEFVSGGGFWGRSVPTSLAREGAAMREALVADLAALPGHRIVTTADPRFPIGRSPEGVEVVTLRSGGRALLGALIGAVDAAWLVAPETGGRLERLAARAERSGTLLLGSSAAAIRRASDKGGLARRLLRHGVPHPPTRVVVSKGDCDAAARELGFPLVVKPARGAGCSGVSRARRGRELAAAFSEARRAGGAGPLVVQRYVPGVAASVSLLADGRRAVPLALNAQSVRLSRPFAYRGGTTPLDHPLAARAAAVAREACQTLPGLRGYVGVDMVLTESEAFVIEINPRLTTAYLGVRSALQVNVAALALAACAGTIPPAPPARRRVRYTASGGIATVFLPGGSL